jgi:hypothetical protein
MAEVWERLARERRRGIVESSSGARQYLRQLGDVRRDPPRLILSEQLGGRSAAGLLFEIDERQFLPGAILHYEAGFQFIDRPGRREAAGACFRLRRAQGRQQSFAASPAAFRGRACRLLP